MITINISTYLAQINEEQNAALRVMQDTAIKFHNDLNCGAPNDIQRYLNDIQKALNVYDECSEEKSIILREKEKGLTLIQLRLQNFIIKKQNETTT